MIYRLLFIVMFTATSNAFAADGSSGCGVGWYILKQNSLVSSFTRALVNATFSNTFAMTTGTSNCAKHSIVQNEKRSLHFVESNFQMVKTEVAQGRGVYLAALADTMGCSILGTEVLARTFQENYDSIYHSKDSAAAVLSQMQRHVMQNPEVARACGTGA